MKRPRRTLRCAIAAIVLAVPSGCSDDRDNSRRWAQERRATATPTVPFLLLRSPGWTLTGGATADDFPGGLEFGGIWTTSYESWPEPNRSVGAAMMIAQPDRGLRALASELGTVSDVTINGDPGVGVEENSPQDGHFIATHVLWKIDSYVAWFTVYDTRLTNAVAIARGLDRVEQPQWHRAVDRAD